MTPLRQRFIEDMQLRGTPQELKRLTPGQSVSWRNITTAARTISRRRDLRQYFLYLANEKKWARASTTIALCGIKFFYERTQPKATGDDSAVARRAVGARTS